MPTVRFNHLDLSKIQERFGIKYSKELLGNIGDIGCSVEDNNSEDIEIEIFPDRTDLLSPGTLAYASRTFIHRMKPNPELLIESSGISLDVDSSLKTVRPIIYAAVVKGVQTGETEEEINEFIQTIMDHQEKLHFSLGKRRSKASIGVHDLSKLKPNFKVIAVDEKYKFIPLAMDEEMNINEILTKHPKGVDYAHLLGGMNKFPIIIDSNEDVLSFPPIINGEHTTVNNSTKDFFIDVTGWDSRACECCLLLVCLELAARGGVIQSVKINDCDDNEIITPNGSPVIHQLTQRLLDSMLGKNFNETELTVAINRMGGNYLGCSKAPSNSQKDAKKMSDIVEGDVIYKFEMPRWRFDILHPIDLVEEIAIGHGYEDLGADVPKTPLAGAALKSSNFTRRFTTCLQGLGLQQITSLTLSNENDQFHNVRWDEIEIATILANPITVDHTLLRTNLLPGLLRLLSANKHNELPQRVYELGQVVRNHVNETHASWLIASPTGGFAEGRGMLQAIMRDLALDKFNVKYELKETLENQGPWLKGRGAEIFVSKTKVGEIGEIDPHISQNFELNVPIHGAELYLDKLMKLVQDPVH
ncbi:MAG TPA: phenylalanine--tRNA ligase subunit beta [Candidatus Poseidoniaceae archaeon]|nr:phenylalanine--tRNA ligase subunit beta [Candidatus Poseidoniaceae archaeon]